MDVYNSAVVDYDPTRGRPVDIPPDTVQRWPDGYRFANLPTFEIGLVLAGAISAGAYIGGVLDYLFEALDAFEAEKEAQYAKHQDNYASWTIPAHNVRIKVIAGASAGGMTGAIMAAAAQYRFPHITDRASAETSGLDNPFYNAWVRQIDMKDFLGTRDMADPVLHSVFDCSKLDEIVKQSLGPKPGAVKVSRAWLSDPFKLVLTVTNLRGIPYQFTMPGSPQGFYASTQHADVMRFSLSASGLGETRPDEQALRWGRDPATWTALGQAALASGSFPVALRSRTLRPPATAYDGTWMATYSAKDETDPESDYRLNIKHLTPAWGVNLAPYSYASADGGIINNVPLDHARVELAGLRGRNPRDAGKAMRAVILVDPLPDPPSRDNNVDAEKEGLMSLMGATIGAMKNQARFHPEDIFLAASGDVYSRYIINPNRTDPQRGTLTGGLALACGALGGFSGFLHESYRHHDFMLGRLNCESFLRNELALKVSDGVRPRLFAVNRDVDDADLRVERPQEGGPPIVERVIIPLTGVLQVPADTDRTKALAWPVNQFFPESLRGQIQARLGGVATHLITAIKNPILRQVLSVAWNAGLAGGAIRREIANSAIKAIGDNLATHRLITRGAGDSHGT